MKSVIAIISFIVFIIIEVIISDFRKKMSMVYMTIDICLILEYNKVNNSHKSILDACAKYF